VLGLLSICGLGCELGCTLLVVAAPKIISMVIFIFDRHLIKNIDRGETLHLKK
jgi:hypothetical protein